MTQYGIKSIYYAYRDRRALGKNSLVTNDILSTLSSAASTGEQWAGEMTYFKTKEGQVYVAAIFGPFTRKVIGGGGSKNHETDLVKGALKMSITLEDVKAGCIFHGDQGSEYCSEIYQKAIAGAGLQGSMS